MAATSLTLPDTEADSGRESPPVKRKLARTTPHSMASMEFALPWECENGRHTDCYFAQKLKLWGDIFPQGLESEVLEKPVGDTVRNVFEPDSVIPAYTDKDHFTLEPDMFRRHRRTG